MVPANIALCPECAAATLYANACLSEPGVRCVDERCEQAISSAAVEGATQRTVKLEGLAQVMASSEAQMRSIAHVKTRANRTIADMATLGVAVRLQLCDQQANATSQAVN